jgi:NTE family protein
MHALAPVTGRTLRASVRAMTESKPVRHPDFDCVALLLQGGGALGAYQAGVYQALAEGGIHPNWIAGISIGAVNAAIIAGNAPEHRLERLRQFWQEVTAPPGWSAPAEWQAMFTRGDAARTWINQVSSAFAAVAGAPGFFQPRMPPPWLHPPGTIEATSYYDTSPLKATLERLVDFDRINSKDTRLSVGAVNVRTGNFVYFDSKRDQIKPAHIIASGALPPGFPAVEIDGEHYWDGGIVSNTPLQWVVENSDEQDLMAFQVDLWSARGHFPRTMSEVMTRQKEIQYSSRTRAGTTWLKKLHDMRCAIADIVARLPPELKNTPAAKLLDAEADPRVYNIIHLIYRPQNYEGDSKDVEFSRLTMEEHWRAGHNDAKRTLRHPEVFQRPSALDGVFTFDLAVDGRE